jgi:hypothetical protein
MARKVALSLVCLLVIFLGCAKRERTPANASKEELEQRLVKHLKYAQVTLETLGSGKYKGQAVGHDGVKYDLQVEIEGNVLKYVSKSDRGGETRGTLSWHETSSNNIEWSK